jgi:hypothetical protein
MSAALKPVPQWLIQCKDSGLFVSDFSAHTVTVTAKKARAVPMEFTGANRMLTALAVQYPRFQWHAVAPVGG